MTLYILCFALFLVGIYGILTQRNMIKIIIWLSFMEFSVFLFLALIGYIEGGAAPILSKNLESGNFVDPLPQAMVLTAIVIGFGVQAFAIVLFKRAYKTSGTDDLDELKSTDEMA